MALAADQLLGMSQAELDTLFSAHDSGPIPDGEARGTAIIAPGTVFSAGIAEAINLFAWKGKIFDAQAGFLRNEILPFALKAIVARVYKAPSWLDGKECIVLDYSETSLVASHIRDEIRLVDDGFYLGKVYWDSKRLIDFSLDFRKAGTAEFQGRTKVATDERLAEMREKASGTWDKLEKVFEDRVARALHALNVPSSHDIESLSKRVHELTVIIKKLSAKAG